MIYLMRHGKDDEKRIGGWSNAPLTDAGIKQVENARDFIVSRDLKIDRILTSDIARAKQTAEIINQTLNVPLEETKLLRELNKGNLNGLTRDEVPYKYYKYLNVKDVNVQYPAGESFKAFYNRIRRSLDEILKKDNTLIVTHRGVINMIYFILLNMPLDTNKNKFGVTQSSIHEYNDEKKLIKRIYY